MTDPVLRRTRSAVAISAALGGLLLAAFPAAAAPEHRDGPLGALDKVHQFDGSTASGGGAPDGALALAADGHVYGVAGHVTDAPVGGSPVGVFQVTVDGFGVDLLSTLGVGDAAVLASPRHGLVAVSPRVLCGAVDAATPGGRTVLHRFATDTPVGCSPQDVLAEGADGSLYGAMQVGGDNGEGTLWRLTPQGKVVVLYQEPPWWSAESPSVSAAVTPASDGWIYAPGTKGGSIWRLAPDGSGAEWIASFDVTSTGYFPSAMVELADGGLYGAAVTGGPSDAGTVFRFDTATHVITSLHAFPRDGSIYGPVFPPTLAADGYLYGQAQYGGTYGDGGVYRLRPDGSDYGLVVEFAKGPDGKVAAGPLLALPDGRLLGARTEGSGDGTLFTITPAVAARR